MHREPNFQCGSMLRRNQVMRMPESAWKKITCHLERNRLLAEKTENEREYRKALQEESRRLRSHWDNSLQNTRDFEKESDKKKEEDKIKLHLRIRKEQEEARKEYLEKAKRTMYYDKAFPKQLNGALLEADAIYEREKQIEFKKMLLEHEKEVEKMYSENVKKAAEEEVREKQEQREKEIQKRKQLKEMYLKDISDKKTFIKRQRERRKANEILDNKNATVELKKQAQMEAEDKVNNRTRLIKDLKDFLKKKEEMKLKLQREDIATEKAAEIFNEAKDRIDCLRKEKQEELRQQMSMKNTATIKVAFEAKQAQEDDYERKLQKAQEDVERKAEEKLVRDREIRESLRKERKENRKQYLEHCVKMNEEKKELRKWSILNRIKMAEIQKQYDDCKVKDAKEAIAKYGEELCRDIRENEKRAQLDRELLLEQNQRARERLEAEDKMFFEYANELMQFNQSRGRSVVPIIKVVKDYKKKCWMKEENTGGQYMEQCLEKTNLINFTPGKMAHDPRSDPNFGKSKCDKEQIYN